MYRIRDCIGPSGVPDLLSECPGTSAAFQVCNNGVCPSKLHTLGDVIQL